MKAQTKVRNFFVFNPLLSGGCEEDEHLKKIYYYPETAPINEQVRNVGFVEAIIQFTSTFKPSRPVHFLQTTNRQQYYFEAEPNYWLVLTVDIQSSSKTENGHQDGHGGRVAVDSAAGDARQTVHEAFLTQTYERYKILNGDLLDVGSVQELAQRLGGFFRPYFEKLNLDRVDVLSVLGGVKLLPLPKHPFLLVQCFLNAIVTRFRMVQGTCFYYDDHIVSTGIPGDDNLRNLNRYLVEHVIQRVRDEDIGGKIFAAAYQGKFLKCPEVIYLMRDGRTTRYRLIVYNVLKTYLCMLTEVTTVPQSATFIRDMELFIGPEMVRLNSVIFQLRVAKSPAALAKDSSNRIVYFNRNNLSCKNNIHDLLPSPSDGAAGSSAGSAVSGISLHLIADMRAKLAHESAGEIIVKTLDDVWVVGKVSNSRELYIVLENKNATLIDISSEVRKICDNELKGIYF